MVATVFCCCFMALASQNRPSFSPTPVCATAGCMCMTRPVSDCRSSASRSCSVLTACGRSTLLATMSTTAPASSSSFRMPCSSFRAMGRRSRSWLSTTNTIPVVPW